MAVHDDRANRQAQIDVSMRLRVIGLDCNNNAILHDNTYAANT